MTDWHRKKDDVNQMDLYWEGRNNDAMDEIGNIPGVGRVSTLCSTWFF